MCIRDRIDAWSKASNAEHILMLSDGNAEYTHALDMVLDVSGFGMGLRSQRYAMVVDNHEIKYIGVLILRELKNPARMLCWHF